MNVLTLDLETSVGLYNKRKASPFLPENYIVAAGYQRNDEDPICHYFAEKLVQQFHSLPLEGVDLIVGFNIKFDLLWLWNKADLRQFFRRGGKIWCCQYAHYLLNGMQQSAHMASMNSITESYGGDLKIDEVKELWNQGVDTPDIDEDLLIRYLTGDVRNTYTIYTQQVRMAKEQNIHTYQMIQNRMDGLLATTEMEYRGLQIDQEVGEQDRAELASESDRLAERLNSQLPQLPEEFQFNWGSHYHRSYLLYGGVANYHKWIQHTGSNGELSYANKTIDMVVEDPVGTPYRYKSGARAGHIKTKKVQVPDLTKPKGKQQEFYYRFPRLVDPKPEWKGDQHDASGAPIYSTSAAIIAELGHYDVPLLKDLALLQKCTKDLGTYYWKEDKNGKRKGMLTLVGVDGRIHHKLNHTSTVTGRLSSSDPNMQNIPRGDKSLAKRMFTSRFGEAGRIIEADYSQLEVIVQAILSGDDTLKGDIKRGDDLHLKRLAQKTGRDYDELKHLHLAHDPDISAQRTAIKGFTFQRAFGAGAAAIALSTGMSVESVKDLILADNKMYPGIAAFDKRLQQAIEESQVGTRFVFDGEVKYIAKQGEWFSPTGTRWVWTQGLAPDFMRREGIPLSFSPTERKNWPVQGTGGEIVQTMIGKLWRVFSREDNFNSQAFLVNTVHDSVVIDCHESRVEEVAKKTCQILSAVPYVFNRCFHLGIDVPFPVEAKVGPNWYEMKEIDV